MSKHTYTYFLIGIEKILSIHFENQELLKLALTHRSYTNEQKGRDAYLHNERLELLGDSILGFCITEYLYLRFPDRSEGRLSQLKSYIVSAESLGEIARSLKIGSYLSLGKGEKQDQGEKKDSVLANMLEALIGAYYIDQGMEQAKKFVIFLLKSKVDLYQNSCTPQDCKLQVQEFAQRNFKSLPLYQLREILANRSPSLGINQKTSKKKKHSVYSLGFEADLYINNQFICMGKGLSKKQAEKEAAKIAVEKLLEDK